MLITYQRYNSERYLKTVRKIHKLFTYCAVLKYPTLLGLKFVFINSFGYIVTIKSSNLWYFKLNLNIESF